MMLQKTFVLNGLCILALGMTGCMVSGQRLSGDGPILGPEKVYFKGTMVALDTDDDALVDRLEGQAVFHDKTAGIKINFGHVDEVEPECDASFQYVGFYRTHQDKADSLGDWGVIVVRIYCDDGGSRTIELLLYPEGDEEHGYRIERDFNDLWFCLESPI